MQGQSSLLIGVKYFMKQILWHLKFVIKVIFQANPIRNAVEKCFGKDALRYDQEKNTKISDPKTKVL